MCTVLTCSANVGHAQSVSHWVNPSDFNACIKRKAGHEVSHATHEPMLILTTLCKN